MFIKIFRPKWQHRNAQLRMAALQELAASDPILIQVAREDSEPSVRQHALRRIEDLHSLLQLLAAERDEAVREACSKRLKRLLAGQEANLPLAQRLQFLGACAEEAVTAYVLQHATDAELRRAALATVSRPALLAEVALRDPSAELRLAALERIERRATLERIAREARGKDKQVARRAKERLDAERTAERRPQRQEEICEALALLARQGGVDLVSFRRLEEEWNSLLPAASPELNLCFENACAAFNDAHARVQAEAALAARQRELCERIEQLQREVDGEGADLYAMDSAITMLERAWVSLEEEWPGLSSNMRERFHVALSRTRQRRAERIRQTEELARLQALLARLGQLLAEEGGFDATTLQRIEAEWRAASGHERKAHAVVSERFDQLLEKARKRLHEQGESARALQQEYGVLLGQMEAALSEGRVQQASSCSDRLADREKKLDAFGSRPSLQQQHRRKVANARLRELRDWRRFGTDQAREELLNQMESLRAAPLAPLKQAEAVKALRTAWRELDRKDGSAADALWQAFDLAAEAAYVPCQEYYDAQARQRQENMAARRQFIAELEQQLGAIDWEQPDWAALEQWLQQAKKRWTDLGGVERGDWLEVNSRFREVMAACEQHLAVRRESEKQRREALIRQVESLHDDPDLQKALAATREAQAGWRPDVCCPQRTEQALWRRFRSACDAVYARQKATVDEQRREEAVQTAFLQQLCEQAEALAVEAQQQPESLRKRMAALQQQWRDSSRPQRHNKGLEQRFAAAMAGCQQAEEAAMRHQEKAFRQRLIAKADLCDQAESMLFGTAQPPLAEEVDAAWQALEALPDARFEQALAERMARTLEQLQSGVERSALHDAAEGNLEKRLALVLQLEILAGLDSPAEFAEARLAMQVQMLAGAMTGQVAEAERQAQLQQLLDEYLVTGPIPPGQVGGLQQRIAAVLSVAT